MTLAYENHFFENILSLRSDSQGPFPLILTGIFTEFYIDLDLTCIFPEFSGHSCIFFTCALCQGNNIKTVNPSFLCY